MSESETIKGFACICGELGKIKYSELRQSVKEELNAEDFNFVNHVISILNWKYAVSIEAIPTDMWSAICAETLYDKPVQKFYIQCDLIEDGFALLYKKVKEYRKDNPINLDDEDE